MTTAMRKSGDAVPLDERRPFADGTSSATISGSRPRGRELAGACDGLPAAGWDLVRLGRRADFEGKQITACEIDAAPHYWVIGKVLPLAKRHVDHGQWGHWLKAHGIDRARAYRARLLAGAFASLDQLDGLTLREALKLALASRDVSPTDEKAKIRRRLKVVNRILLAIADNVELLRDREGLSGLVERCEQALACVRLACQRPSAPPVDGGQGGQEEQLPCETDHSGIREDSGRCGGSSELSRVPLRAK